MTSDTSELPTLHEAFAVKYRNHGLKVPTFFSSNSHALEEQYTRRLLANAFFKRDYNELVPDFLRGKIKAPRFDPFDFQGNYDAERRMMLTGFNQLHVRNAQNKDESLHPKPKNETSLIASLLDFPQFSLEFMLYKSAGSAIEYQRYTADSKEYTNPKKFQQIFESALSKDIFANRDGQPLVAVHCGAGLQEGVWFDMIKKTHGYATTPTFTDNSINMLRICKAFNPEAEVTTSKKLKGPVICIANNCLPNMPASSIPSYIDSLHLPKGSLLFATAVTEMTDTTPEFYYHADRFFGAMMEDLFFIPRTEIRKGIDFSKQSSGTGSRFATQRDKDDMAKYGYLETVEPEVDQVDLMEEIDVHANFRKPIPMHAELPFPELTMPRKVHVTSSHRLNIPDIVTLIKDGARLMTDKTNSTAALIYQI